MKTTFFDYQIFQTPDLEKFFENLSGSNEREVLVAFFDENQEMLMDFLKKIIASAKLDLEKDCLVLSIPENTEGGLPSFSSLKSIGKIEKAVLFGIRPKDLGLNIETPPYLPTHFNNCTFLFADKLSLLEKSPDKKKALWACLQQMFL